MKSIVLKKLGSVDRAFEIQERPDPVPGDGEVLIQVEYSGLNFADVLARLGLYPEAPPLPSVLGYDVVGRVEKIGAGVTHLRAGARVLAFTRFGGYSDRVVTSVQGCVEIPDSWDGAAATALATQASTAWYCAEEMVRIHKGDHVLVHAAAGGVGLFLIQLARRRGAIVYGTAGSDTKLARIKELGVQHPINYREKDFAEECRRLSNGHGMDVIFDSLGGSTFRKGMKLLRPGGRNVVFGVAEAAGTSRSVLRMGKTMASFGLIHPVQLLTSSKAVIGVNMLRIAEGAPHVLNRCLSSLIEAVKSGELKLEPATIFPAQEVGRAHEALASRKTMGKVALQW
jgi:NADPH:quinone reductase-like Zn-dependent oxidoreductase